MHRLSYGVWLLQEISQHTPANVTMYIMYDIACTLAKHLKRNEDHNDPLKRMILALPSFHAYGHNAACQVSPQLNMHLHACMHVIHVCFYALFF